MSFKSWVHLNCENSRPLHQNICTQGSIQSQRKNIFLGILPKFGMMFVCIYKNYMDFYNKKRTSKSIFLTNFSKMIFFNFMGIWGP